MFQKKALYSEDIAKVEYSNYDYLNILAYNIM